MKSFTLLLICLLLLGAAQAMPNRFRARANFGGYLKRKLPRNRFRHNKRLMQRVEPLMQKIIAKGGCNANVCFLLDGSRYVTDDEYRMQKEFVELSAALIGVSKDAHFAASLLERPRYGAISPLTFDQDAFLARVAGSSRSGGRPKLGGGIRFCVRQMRARREDANKIVLIGDGRGRHTAVPFLRPLRRFFRRGGAVCAVGVGNVNRNVLQAITRNPAHVLAIDGYIELSEIVENIVAEVCALK